MLLRSSQDNYLILSRGSPRSIVLGISGKPEEHLHLDQIQKDRIPTIRRFSGGGTVIVDENTLFITFIISDAVSIPHFPEPILRWGEELFAKSWNIPGFRLIENDYVIGDKKCGGNAQYIQRSRWLHHTSFLWDYHIDNMNYLRLPPKRPLYRQSRSHADFLCKLKHYAPSKEWLFERLIATVGHKHQISSLKWEEIEWKPHRKSVHLIA